MHLIDFHTHVLPRLDHGCAGSEMSLRQLALLADAGVRTVCATSHFYPHKVMAADFLRDRQGSLMRLAEVIAAREEKAPGEIWQPGQIEIPGGEHRPAVRPGAEVLVCEGLEHMEDLADLCLSGTDLILLEMPLSAELWRPSHLQTVREVAENGLRPVLAHVDRYPPELIEPLLREGIPGQVNADALARLFLPRHLLQWIENGWIVALGSDLHGDDPKGMAPFLKVCKKMPERVETIMHATSGLMGIE